MAKCSRFLATGNDWAWRELRSSSRRVVIKMDMGEYGFVFLASGTHASWVQATYQVGFFLCPKDADLLPFYFYFFFLQSALPKRHHLCSSLSTWQVRRPLHHSSQPSSTSTAGRAEWSNSCWLGHLYYYTSKPNTIIRFLRPTFFSSCS